MRARAALICQVEGRWLGGEGAESLGFGRAESSGFRRLPVEDVGVGI